MQMMCIIMALLWQKTQKITNNKTKRQNKQNKIQKMGIEDKQKMMVNSFKSGSTRNNQKVNI